MTATLRALNTAAPDLVSGALSRTTLTTAPTWRSQSRLEMSASR